MSRNELILLILFLSFSANTSAQDLVKELSEVRRSTTNRIDSLQKMIAESIEPRNQSTGRDSLSIQSRIEELDQLIDKIKIEQMALDVQFIKKHINTSFALQVMSEDLWKYAASFYLDSFLSIYENFSEYLKSGKDGKQLAENLKNFKQTNIGSFPPDFIAQDVNGKTVRLSSFRGTQFVLIDFWASWCAPCRQDFSTLKMLQGKYSSNGLNIISISRDDDLDAWKEAIEKDSTSDFVHISTKQNNAPLLSQFFVWAIPVKILINKEGKIIGRWRGGGEANKNSLISTIENLFE